MKAIRPLLASIVSLSVSRGTDRRIATDPFSVFAVGGSRGRAHRPQFPHFHAVFGENWSNAGLVSTLRIGAPFCKILAPPLIFFAHCFYVISAPLCMCTSVNTTIYCVGVNKQFFF